MSEYVAHPENGVPFEGVPAVIQSLTRDATVKVTGEVPTIDGFLSIKFALKNSKANIYLDLSAVTLHGSDLGGDFEGCTRLSGITLPNTTRWIKVAEFMNCTQLASITIPASVSRIDTSAFGGCTSLKTVNFRGSKKQWKAIDIGKDGNKSLLKAKIN